MGHPFSAARLRRSASFRRLTGISAGTFDHMLKQLQAPWEAEERRKIKPGRPSDVGGLEDHLLVMLMYYLCYVTQEFIGYFYHVDRSAICRAIQRIERHAKPMFGVQREPRVSGEEAAALIIDCTEQPIQRPSDNAQQKTHYSEKRSAPR